MDVQAPRGTSSHEPVAAGRSEGGNPATAAAVDVMQRIVVRAREGAGLRARQMQPLKADLARLESEHRALDRLDVSLTEVQSAREGGRHGDALLAFRRAARLRKDAIDVDELLLAELNDLVIDLELNAAAVAAELGRTLPPALEDVGIRLDQRSRFPEFFVREGYITIKILQNKGEAQLASRGGVKKKASVDAVSLAKEVAELHATVFDRHVDSAAFLEALSAAYEMLREAGAGESVPIDELADQMKTADKSMSMDGFLVELEALVYGHQSIEQGGPVVKLDTTKDTRRGVLLPGHETSGYKGYLKLVAGERKRNSGDEGHQLD